MAIIAIPWNNQGISENHFIIFTGYEFQGMNSTTTKLNLYGDLTNKFVAKI